MPAYAYQRLSAQDQSFLVVESPSAYMHLTATALYPMGPFRTPGGGFDIDALQRVIRALLPELPRYRQKLRWIDGSGATSAVWIDDPDFNLDYHIRHTALPRPGTLEQLRAKVARIHAHHLDRSRPLWEMWVVEGVEGDRFALITNVHHCVVDGAAGADLMQVLHSVDPERPYPDPPPNVARPEPSDRELRRALWLRRLSFPAEMLRGFRTLREQVEDLGLELRTRAAAVARLLGSYATRLPPTPVTGEVGPRRSLAWLDMALEPLRELRRQFGCTLNDVVLAIVAGAVRDLFLRRHTSPEGFDFRVTAPVSVRSAAERGVPGNRLSSWILRLPIDEADPLKRVSAIRAQTVELKESRQALGAQIMLAAADWAPGFVLALAARALARPLPAHLMVTNVPGPQRPLFLKGAELLAVYPFLPLMPHTALGVGVFSYNGKLFWGLSADPDLLPDLPRFSSALESSFEALAAAAGVKPAPPAVA
jgi:WS/DGAT/MGAT family acyltransferase